jgi:SagB-type dehydrogenase family enzyme
MAQYRLNEQVQLLLDGSAEAAWSVRMPESSPSKVRIEESGVVALLAYCAEERDVDEMVSFLQARTDMSSSEVTATINDLVSKSVLVSEPPSEDLKRWFRYNWIPALQYHLSTRGASGADSSHPSAVEVSDSGLETEDRIELPAPDELPDIQLTNVMQRRRTCRDFVENPISVDDISTVLYYASTPTREVRRRMGTEINPKDWGEKELGAIPVNVYLFASRVDGLNSGVYRYDIRDHSLISLATDLPSEEAERLPANIYASKDDSDDAAIALLYSVDFELYQRLFPYARALRGAYANVARRAHRLLLVATAIGYREFQSAAINHEYANDLVGVNRFSESVLYMVAVGDGELNPGLGG